MEDFFINLGLSWTLSKILPFIIALLLGVLVFLYLRQKSKVLKWIGGASILVFPVIYFAINPIYEGDFTNDFHDVNTSEVDVKFANGKLTVLAIPNCPFCYESINRLKLVSDRAGGKEFDFLVLTSDRNNLEFYKEIGNGTLNIDNVTEFEEYTKLSKGRYPTFVYRDGDNLKVWSNRGFGVVALDWIEEKLSQQ